MPRIASITAAWNRFWFAPTPAHSLCLLRIFFAATFVMRMTGLHGLWRVDELTMALPKRGIFPVGSMLGGWRMPYPVLEWLLPLPGAWQLARIEELLLILGVLLMVGLWTRYAAPLLAGLLTYVFLLSMWNYHHHMLLFVIVFWILAFSPCARHFSLDARLRDPDRPQPPMSAMPLRMIQVLVCVLYLFTFLWKCNASWLDGTIMRIFHDAGSMQGLFIDAFDQLGVVPPYRAMGLATLAIEGAFVLLIWPRRPRAVMLWLGVMLHLGVDALMHVNTYSYQIMALYIAFIHPAAGATVVLYDGKCNMCRTSQRYSAMLDWLARVTWLDFRDPDVRRRVPQISDEDLEKQMYVFTPEGRALPGYRGWRRLLASFPLTFLIAPIFYLWPVTVLGDRIYRHIAANRRLSCAIPQPDDTFGPWQTTLDRARERA